MKTKKIGICLILCALLAGLFSSCAIDRKCPAYTQVPVSVKALELRS